MAVPVLLYHQIAALPHKKIPFRGLWVHPDKFRSQMAWLKRLGYQGLSLRNALPYIKGEKMGKVVVITFDDGFLNNYENALPVLAEFGFTATNYFVANQLGGSNVWDQAMGVPVTPCMSVEQMREWAELGHEVGAHTLDHVNLEKTPEEEARRQIVQSKTMLEDMLGSEVTNFAYPYGGNLPIHRDMCREAGYETATTTVHARARADDDPFAMPRVYVRRRDLAPKFIYRLMTR
ncbi:polysaccharide deacetylase family protein [Brucella gallinifaecis]|uniref:Chitooligosaccharide deacetylase n=1 Tax=Brucella gallinifaecis TaxID=215590 RepID=A0A502BP72_9HYPH|nr:polysaccharide deacetylase family protein [Brucella gallinifaecis]TPF76332.1 polysaccharide deacetylase family protein [Brucella gallinifaecis]